MSQIVFSVRSESSGELYRLEASRTQKGIRFTCTCQAGVNGQHCKHRMAILLNDTSACVEVDEATISTFTELTAGSELLALVDEMGAAEREVELAKKEFARAKKAVARALAG